MPLHIELFSLECLCVTHTTIRCVVVAPQVHGNDDSGNENSSDSGEEDDDGPEESTDARTLQSDAAARKMEPIAKRHKKVVINHPSDEEPSVSGGSEENEKSSEWSGSNDSSSNQDSSLTGSTSRESGSGSNKNSISEPGESGNSLGDTATSKGSGSSASQLMNGSDSGRAAGDKDEAPQLDYQHLLHHNSNHMQHLLMLQQQNQFGSSFGQHQVHPSHPNYLLLEQYILRNPMIPLRSAAAIDTAKALNLLGFNSSIGVEDGVPSAAGALRAEGEGLVRRKDAGAPSSVNKLSALGELPIDSLLYHPSMVTAPSSMPSSMLFSKTSKSTESSSLPSKGQMRGGLPVVAAGGVFLNSTLAAVTAAATHYDKPYASNSETQQHAKNGSSKGSRSHNGSRSNRI